MEELYYLEEAELQMKKMVRTAQFYDDMKILQIREAENRAFMEDGGSFETLCNFYEEAAEEVEKKKNIFKRAWEAILNFCRKIKELFTKNKTSNVDNNKEVSVDKNKRDIRKKLISFFNKWKNALAHPRSNPKAFLKTVAPLAALLASIVALKAVHSHNKKSSKKNDQGKVRVKVKELQKDQEDLNNVVLNTITSAAEEMTQETGTETSEEINKAKQQMSAVASEVKSQVIDIQAEIKTAEQEISNLRNRSGDLYSEHLRLEMKGNKEREEKISKNPEELSDEDKNIIKRGKKLEAEENELVEKIRGVSRQLDKISEDKKKLKEEKNKEGISESEKERLTNAIDKLIAEEKSLLKESGNYSRRWTTLRDLEDKYWGKLKSPEVRKRLKELEKEMDKLTTKRQYYEKRIKKLKGMKQE